MPHPIIVGISTDTGHYLKCLLFYAVKAKCNPVVWKQFVFWWHQKLSMSGGISPIYSPCNWARLTQGEADLSSISSSNFVFFKENGDIYKRISLPVNHCVQCIPAMNHNKHTSGIIILSNGAPTLQIHSFSHQLQGR